MGRKSCKICSNMLMLSSKQKTKMPNNEEPPIEKQSHLHIVEKGHDLESPGGDNPTAAQQHWRQFGPKGDSNKLTDVLHANARMFYEFPEEGHDKPDTPPDGRVIQGPWGSAQNEESKVALDETEPRHQ